MAEVISRSDLVRVRNLGKTPLNVAYNSKATVIPPGAEGIVDREAACAHFGVWWSVPGVRSREVPDRADEYLRVRGLYGCLPGAPQSQDWDKLKPRIEIFEMNGTKVSTVIDDPEGKNIPVTDRDDDAQLRQTVATLQEQLEKVQGQLERQQALESSMSIPEADSPDNAPKRMRQSPRVQGAGE